MLRLFYRAEVWTQIEKFRVCEEGGTAAVEALVVATKFERIKSSCV